MTATVTAVNQTQSLAAIRNFVRAAVSFITYARGLCSNNAYEQRPFLGLPLRQLIPSTIESITISEWIEKGAFDALNRNYLKEMSLCVYDEACKELLESYCFGFNYSADGRRAQMSLSASRNAEDRTSDSQVNGRDGETAMEVVAATKSKTVPAYRHRRCSKQEVQRMLMQILERLLELVGCLPPLLSKRVLTMRLIYYDEVTPADYEPPCFAPASRRMVQLYQKEVKLHVHIGSMDTSHHFFSVAIRHPLLQHIQHQIRDQMTIATAAEAAAAAGQSAPLQSGLESTFSSEAMTYRRAPSTRHRNIQQQNVVTVTSEACPSTISEKMRDVCTESLSGAAEVDDGDNDEKKGAAAGDIDAVKRNTKSTLCTLDSVQHLVEDATAASPKRRSLRPYELAYLLFASFVFSHAPSVRGGRGRVSQADVDAYRVQSCPVDLTEETTHLMLQQLCSEGFLVPCHNKRGICTNSGKAKQPSFLKSSATVSEWALSDPPLTLLQPLLQLTAVTQLLTHPCRLALQELCIYLEREKSRAADAVSLASRTVMQNRKRGRGA